MMSRHGKGILFREVQFFRQIWLWIIVLIVSSALLWNSSGLNWLRADILSRYLLAVPGAAIASIALRHQSKQAGIEKRSTLATSQRWAAIGFAFYGISQLIVSPNNFFPANIINTNKAKCHDSISQGMSWS